MSIDGEMAVLDILDTAGQEEFSMMQDQWMRDSQGFLLIYSVVARNTFIAIDEILEKIVRSKENAKSISNVCLVIAGNKCDLPEVNPNSRQVNKSELLALAKQRNIPTSSCFECSAKTNVNSATIFEEVVRLIRRENNVAIVSVERNSSCDRCCLIL